MSKNGFSILAAGLLAWIVPGAGYFYINQRARAAIVFVAITGTFLLGIFIGSIGVIDPVNDRIPFLGQMLNSPVVLLLAKITQAGDYRIYGKPAEIGQIYTCIAGLLNLLCVVNTMYLAYINQPEMKQEK